MYAYTLLYFNGLICAHNIVPVRIFSIDFVNACVLKENLVSVFQFSAVHVQTYERLNFKVQSSGQCSSTQWHADSD